MFRQIKNVSNRVIFHDRYFCFESRYGVEKNSAIYIQDKYIVEKGSLQIIFLRGDRRSYRGIIVIGVLWLGESIVFLLVLWFSRKFMGIDLNVDE